MDTITEQLHLTRSSLIALAQLLGSDYCDGVSGVGIVNAMEILHAFPGDDGLARFRDWCWSAANDAAEAVEPEFPSPPSSPTDRAHRNGKGDRDANADVAYARRLAEYAEAYFKYKHRNVRRNWQVPRSFPSEAVRKGYEQPVVDESREPITWGHATDWPTIHTFLSHVALLSDDEIRGVQKEWESTLADRAQNGRQSVLESFFVPKGQVGLVRSERLQYVLHRKKQQERGEEDRGGSSRRRTGATGRSREEEEQEEHEHEQDDREERKEEDRPRARAARRRRYVD